MKKVVILGSTGSIGKNSLEVISNFPDKFKVEYLVAHKNINILQKQIERFNPKGVVILNEKAGLSLKTSVNGNTDILIGENVLDDIVSESDVDIVISSLVGFAGLRPTVKAVRAGKTIAVANKETLVVAGKIIMRLAEEYNAHIVPVDSEHSAILQCIVGEERENIEKIYLTGSGGPFLQRKKEELVNVTVEEALNHPNWSMGKKITIDSATLMNKGLEVIEAHHLFDFPPENIDVVIHPQSIIHSMVEFVDGSIKAQMGIPDMKIPIQYALTYPERSASTFSRMDPAMLGQMDFFPPDPEKFPCLRLSLETLKKGGSAPVVLNAANEVAVEKFLNGEIKFTDIPVIIEEALEKHSIVSNPSLELIISIDKEIRDTITKQHDGGM